MPHDCPSIDRCGGCDIAAHPLSVQHERKRAFVQRALDLPEPPSLTASPRPVGHRARIKVAIEGASVGYRAHRSHDLVDVPRCAIARDEVNDALTALRAWLTPERGAPLETIELRSDGSRAVFAVEPRTKSVPAKVRSDLFELGDVALAGRRLCGDPTLRLSVLGHSLSASPRSFYQVNLEANELLVTYVRDAVAAVQPNRTLDLYSGIGNLTLPLAAIGAPVVAVEQEGQATADLQAAIGGANIRVITSPAERFDPASEFFDVAVLDPPRTGSHGVLERLLLNRPRRIVYVSCHAPAAAKELKAAARAGYRLTDVRCFDLFPDTHHVETVVVLDRG